MRGCLSPRACFVGRFAVLCLDVCARRCTAKAAAACVFSAAKAEGMNHSILFFFPMLHTPPTAGLGLGKACGAHFSAEQYCCAGGFLEEPRPRAVIAQRKRFSFLLYPCAHFLPQASFAQSDQLTVNSQHILRRRFCGESPQWR